MIREKKKKKNQRGTSLSQGLTSHVLNKIKVLIKFLSQAHLISFLSGYSRAVYRDLFISTYIRTQSK
jgi:hypothetical protein